MTEGGRTEGDRLGFGLRLVLARGPSAKEAGILTAALGTFSRVLPGESGSGFGISEARRVTQKREA